MSNQTMDTSTPHDSIESPGGVNRRNVLRYGTLGLGALAISACGSAGTSATPGISGDPIPTTDVPPSPPTTLPTEVQLENDLVQIRTASSLELLAAEVYDEYGDLLTDPALAASAGRFAADHRANAAIFGDELSARGDSDPRSGQPNEAVMSTRITPISASLAVDGPRGDSARLTMFLDLENMLAATYINAAGVHTEPEWRSRFAAHASSAARRATLLNGGAAPLQPRFPGTEVVPSAAMLGEVTAEETEGTDGADDAEAEGGDTEGDTAE